MPPDDKVSNEVITKFVEVVLWLDKQEHPDPVFIPLRLNSFGEDTGLGVYESVEDVLSSYPVEDLLPHLPAALQSPYVCRRFRAALIVWRLLTNALLAEALRDLLIDRFLNDEDPDVRWAALMALSEIEDETVERALRQALLTEPEEDLRKDIEKVLQERFGWGT
ncbi:MAG: HEAT repeat domain-containing protein [Armatimonadota bacterium]